MDLQGIAWMGHIYQKFEAMCLEVEETMYQDTVKFVENQVQSVSTNVKRFYSDVMQDLVEPSLEDTTEVAVSDSAARRGRDIEMHKIPKVCMKAKARRVDSGGVIKNSKQIGNLDGNTGHEPSFNQFYRTDDLLRPSSGKSAVRVQSDLYSWQCDDGIVDSKENQCVKKSSKQGKLPPTGTSGGITPAKEYLSRVSSFSELSNEKLEALHGQRTSGPISLESTGLASVGESCDEINNEGMVATNALDEARSTDVIGVKEMNMRLCSSCGSLAESNAADLCTNDCSASLAGSSIKGNIQCNEFANKVIVVSNPAQLAECTLDAMSGAVVVQDMETVQELDPVNVGESCHLVNGAELPFIPQKERKRKPYKKRIRDAISSRMGSTREQEYKQLAVSFRESGKSNQGSKEHSQSVICESEWELL